MSGRPLAGTPPPGLAEGRPEISWIPDWLDRRALATLGPVAGFVVAVAAAFALVSAFEERLRPVSPSVLLPSALLYVATLGASVFWFPHWWAWRVCGPRGEGRFLGAALWLAHFPSKELGESARALAASALCAGDYLGVCAADNLGVLALALHVARVGDVEKSAVLHEAVVRQPPLRDPLARLLRRYALEAVAAALLRRGEPREALAWAELGRGRGMRYLRLVARERLGEPVPKLRLARARLLAPYRRDSLRPPAPFPMPAAPARLHLWLLASAAAGTLTPAPLEALAKSWAGRLGSEAKEELEGRAAELEEGIDAELALMAAAARGEWPAEGEDGLAAPLRRGRAAALYALLEQERQRFEGSGSESGGVLVELDRWLGMRLAVERLARLEGQEAVAALWLGGLRHAACNWPIRLWNGEGERALLPCYLMSLWCAEMGERLGDAETVEVNHEMLARCRRQWERLEAPSLG